MRVLLVVACAFGGGGMVLCCLAETVEGVRLGAALLGFAFFLALSGWLGTKEGIRLLDRQLDETRQEKQDSDRQCPGPIRLK